MTALVNGFRGPVRGTPLHSWYGRQSLVRTALQEAGRELKGARIDVLGYAYLEDSDDTRNSPSETLVRLLREAGAEPVIHDPFIGEHAGDPLQRFQGRDAMVLMVAHSAYRRLDLTTLLAGLDVPVFVDGRGLAEKETGQPGATFRLVGQAAPPARGRR